MREAALWGPARRTFDSLSEEDQAEVSRLVSLIEQYPEVDHKTTFNFPVPPLMFRLFDNHVWQIIYYVPDEATVVIRAIDRAPAD